jgi:acyl carrier protein
MSMLTSTSVPDRQSIESEIRLALQKHLAELLPGAELNPAAHFVDLGGDSLLASRLMGRMSEVAGIDLSPILPFEAESVEDLTMRINALLIVHR